MALSWVTNRWIEHGKKMRPTTDNAEEARWGCLPR
jgi:hypothetical protein